MDIKVGDKVKFLNDIGGGIVVKLLSNNEVLVQIEDGFEVPVIVSQLVKTESMGSKAVEQVAPSIQNTKKEKPKTLPKEEETKKVNPGTLLAIVPTGSKLDSDNASFDCFLINDDEYNICYVFSTEKLEGARMVEKGDLEPGMKVKLASFSYLNLLKIDALRIDLMFYQDDVFKPVKPYQFVFNLKTINLLRSVLYKQNDFFYEDALIIQVADNTGTLYDINEKTIKKAIHEKEHKPKQPAAKPVEPNIEEVDLHIEEITDNFETLSNGEILNIQMARFSTVLEGAILSGKTKKVVFIHGVGNGVLRYEIHKTLKNKYPTLQFQDASFAEYGFGATMVIIK